MDGMAKDGAIEILTERGNDIQKEDLYMIKSFASQSEVSN